MGPRAYCVRRIHCLADELIADEIEHGQHPGEDISKLRSVVDNTKIHFFQCVLNFHKPYLPYTSSTSSSSSSTEIAITRRCLLVVGLY